jgi:uncharacterized protein (DUF2147 family)
MPAPLPRRCLLLAGALLGFGLRPARAQPDGYAGTWLTEDGASKVEITVAGSGAVAVLSGKVVWLKEPQRDGQPLRDANNADAAQRARPIMGLPILAGFKPAADGWSGGTVYSPRIGKHFDAALSLAGDGRLQLKIDAGLLSRTDYWTR